MDKNGGVGWVVISCRELVENDIKSERGGVAVSCREVQKMVGMAGMRGCHKRGGNERYAACVP